MIYIYKDIQKFKNIQKRFNCVHYTKHKPGFGSICFKPSSTLKVKNKKKPLVNLQLTTAAWHFLINQDFTLALFL